MTSTVLNSLAIIVLALVCLRQAWLVGQLVRALAIVHLTLQSHQTMHEAHRDFMALLKKATDKGQD